MKFNTGIFRGNEYYKEVDWNKAVLWKTREISLRISICNEMMKKGVTKVTFFDKIKNQTYIADIEDLRKNKTKRIVGQEEQFYFPIHLFKQI